MTEQNQGTPKDLNQAILIAIQEASGSNGIEFIKAKIRDVLAQKFGAAHMKCHTDEQRAVIEDLWEMITGEKYGAKNEKN